jgi:DNA helicase-2/ATP-dependent DNA helicase PcrA
MLEFPDLFRAARLIKLEENFRSTQPILDVANAIIPGAQDSEGKRLFSRVGESEPPVAIRARP